jgi:hypothetical protein
MKPDLILMKVSQEGKVVRRLGWRWKGLGRDNFRKSYFAVA